MNRPIEPESTAAFEAEPTIADIADHLRAMREAGTLSPDAARLLARAEAHEEATRAMAEVQARLEERLAEIDAEATTAKPTLQ
ncbi:hypothetical protein [Bosea thiooxidans]